MTDRHETVAGVVTTPAAARTLMPGVILVAIVLIVYGSLAITVDFPRAAFGIHSDEATYYMMAYSLADDGDLAYRREDLVRVWQEFPTGPSGVFLKRGEDIVDAGLMRRPPFFWTRVEPDRDASRLFYGKSFIYPLFASPFVVVFGTNGFLVFNALLLALAAWCAYLFLHARMPDAIAAVLAGGLIFGSVVPVYFVWISPELFDFALGMVAYFCWLYKEVGQPAGGDRSGWLFTPRSDLVAAGLIGILTFSKLTNALLIVPIVLWLAWRRRWTRAVAAALLFCTVAAGLFGVNMAISGDWNYQGGDRKTFLWEFPFQNPGSDFNIVADRHGRDEALTDIIFNRRVFWTNLFNNLKWFFVGRYAGLVPYFFPAVFAMVAYVISWRRRAAWEHLVVCGALALGLVFLIVTPYTWGGGGSSIGNRYFLSAYGLFVFLLPPLGRVWVALVPWAVGALFMAPLVLNPFVASFRPGDNAKSGPLRLLPVELTMVYDWPINTDPTRVHLWFGDDPKDSSPGFQIYFFDDNAYQREDDKSFWVKGKSRAEFLIKTDRPMKRLMLTLTAGPVPTEARVTLDRRALEVSLRPGESKQVRFALGAGFPYQGRWPVWVASVSSSGGFTPIFVEGSTDSRYLGIRVKPTLEE